MNYFSFQYSFTMINESKWEKLFKIQRRKEGTDITQSHCNLAFAIQSITEEIALEFAKESKLFFETNNLCLSGGTALNCVMNGLLKTKDIFRNIYVPCSPGDGGGSAGAKC